MYTGRVFQGARDLTAMVYPHNILAFVDENNHQIVKKFESALFNTQVKALKHNGHIFTFIKVMLDLMLRYNKALKGLLGEANMINFELIQAADVLYISSDILKAQGEKVKE